MSEQKHTFLHLYLVVCNSKFYLTPFEVIHPKCPAHSKEVHTVITVAAVFATLLTTLVICITGIQLALA